MPRNEFPTDVLGEIDGVRVELAIAHEPWGLDVDALVVPASRFGGLSDVGEALREHFPAADWNTADRTRLLVDRPATIDVSRAESVHRLRHVLLVPAGGDVSSRVEAPVASAVRALAGGLEAAVRVARRYDAFDPAVGVSLGGMRAGDLDAGDVAEGLVTHLEEHPGEHRPLRVVLHARDVYEHEAVARTLRSASVGLRPTRRDTGAVRSEALQVLTRATGVAARRGSAETEPVDVVLGALVVVHLAGGERTTSMLGALYRALPVPRGERLAAALGVEPDQVRGVERLDDTGVERLLRSADDVAATVGASRAGQHLLAAALVAGPLPDDVLAALGTTQDVLVDALRGAGTAQDGPAWEAVLGRPELAGPFASDRVPSVRGPGPPVADHLGVDVYVAMLAALVARRSTALPLSIGLFGPWGSGKSHFMELMRARVRELASAGSADHHDQVLQLTFNAWHYADTNLWASLASEFFAQLADDQVDPVATRRAAISRRRRETQALLVELEQAQAAAVANAAARRIDLEHASAERTRTSGVLVRAAWRAVVDEDPERVDQVRARLGLPDGDAVLDVVRDVRAARDDARAVRRLLDRRATLVAFVLLVTGLAVVALALALPADVTAWLRGTAGALLTAALAVAGGAVRGARGTMATLRRLAERADEAARSAAGTDPGVVAARDAAARAEAEEVVARTRADDAAGVLAELDRELVDLAPDQRLARFVAERAASEDYRSRLGVTSLVRRDFEQLVALMHEWRRDGASTGAPTPIERIVLYVDDLDRCEPDQVVAVLEAVHLLLAMDLFVVVVGVDPRWLHNALATRHATQLGGDPGATPLNYLEKIFQVPFRLPDMSHGHLERLLRHLAGAPPGPGAARETPSPGSPAPPVASTLPRRDRPRRYGDGNPSPDGQAPTDADPVVAEPGSEIATVVSGVPRAALRGLDDVELRLLGACDRLVTTPRGATRLLNLYGLLRSTRDLHTGAGFLPRAGEAGAFEAVVVLLAVLVGHPHLFEPFVRRLTSGPESSWSEFRGALGPPAEDGQRGEWARLVSGLDAVGALTHLDDLGVFRDWAPLVARFSFSVADRDARD